MDIQATKINLVQQLLNIKKESLLLKIQELIKKEQSAMAPMSLEQYISDIKEADAQIDKGEYKTIEAFEKESAKWK